MPNSPFIPPQFEESYDDLPYPSHTYAESGVDHLAVRAILSGLEPSPLETCRVLELGCGQGLNLLALAGYYPQAEFVGVDAAAQPIEAAQQLAQQFQLNNLNFHHLNLEAIPAEWGQFDYVIAHGVYSWVSPETQTALLKICKQHLKPQGVVYISYNVYPGWHINTALRDLMFFHTRQQTDTHQRAQQARQLLAYLAENLPIESNYFAQYLRQLHTTLSQTSNGYLGHDFLAHYNRPCYFTEFVAQAETAGLQYLANADFNTPSDLPETVEQYLLSLTNTPLESEQYLDFVSNNPFRRTLLCHKEHQLNRSLNRESLPRLRLASAVQASQTPLDIHSRETITFQGPNGVALSTAQPLTKAALQYLADMWPLAVPYPELLKAAQTRLGASPSQAEHRDFDTNLLLAHAHHYQLIDFHASSPRLAAAISKKPLANPALRHLAQNLGPLTNAYHRRVGLTKPGYHLLAALNGQRTHSDLKAILHNLVQQGEMNITQNGTPITNPTLIDEVLNSELHSLLNTIHYAGLLIA
jgi:methyltransferase-like protein/2-polyprenyl-3-methyl-5-hydroxy-6-metoxy-1,4-benzoquinol methylase